MLLVPKQLDSCNEVEEIIALIRVFGLDKIADRLLVLREHERDLEDDEVPMSFGSLKRFARFVITERSLADPRLGVSPDGNVQAEWHCGVRDVKDAVLGAGVSVQVLHWPLNDDPSHSGIFGSRIPVGCMNPGSCAPTTCASSRTPVSRYPWTCCLLIRNRWDDTILLTRA